MSTPVSKPFWLSIHPNVVREGALCLLSYQGVHIHTWTQNTVPYIDPLWARDTAHSYRISWDQLGEFFTLLDKPRTSKQPVQQSMFALQGDDDWGDAIDQRREMKRLL